MNIQIHVDTMKDAERLSTACQKFPYEFFLRAEKFCVDPKSTLGVLAMMYSARDKMYIDTGDMEDTTIPALVKALDSFLVK